MGPPNSTVLRFSCCGLRGARPTLPSLRDWQFLATFGPCRDAQMGDVHLQDLQGDAILALRRDQWMWLRCPPSKVTIAKRSLETSVAKIGISSNHPQILNFIMEAPNWDPLWTSPHTLSDTQWCSKSNSHPHSSAHYLGARNNCVSTACMQL